MRGLCFATESGLERWLSSEIDTKGLDCDVAAEPDVAPAEHLGHASVAEHFAQLVAVAEPPWLSHGGTPSLACCYSDASWLLLQFGLNNGLRDRRCDGAARCVIVAATVFDENGDRDRRLDCWCERNEPGVRRCSYRILRGARLAGHCDTLDLSTRPGAVLHHALHHLGEVGRHLGRYGSPQLGGLRLIDDPQVGPDQL